MGQYRSTALNPLEERVTLTGTAVTIAATHVDKTIYANASGGQTYTVVADADEATPIEVGSRVRVVRYANQTLTFAAGSGATLLNAGSALTARARYSEVVLTKIAADTWRLGGDVTVPDLTE